MSDDDDLTELTSRLANLKPSPTTTTTSAPPPPTDDDLSARFTKLFSRPTVGASTLPKQESTLTDPEDGKSTAELASAVRDAEKPFEIENWEEEETIEWLLKAAVPFKGGPLSDGDYRGGKGTGEVPEWLGRDTMGEVKSSPDEEEEILRRVRDEMEWEQKHGVHTPEREGEGEEDDEAEFARLAARLSSLSPAAKTATVELPAVPKAAPGVAGLRAAAAPKNEEGVSEVDTWCGICNDDAEYRCSGCDGDLYCGECLFDAHTGPEAGYEERRHKWTKYVRPRKVVAA